MTWQNMPVINKLIHGLFHIALVIINFEIPKLTTPTFWKLAPSLENSAKKQHGSKESGSKSEITDRNIYA